MNLDTKEWKHFTLDEIFNLKGGFYNKKPRHAIEGDIPFLASTSSNNGVTEYYSFEDIQSWDKVGNESDTLDKKIYAGNCIAVTVNGSVCNAYYQNKDFTCSHDVTILYARNFKMNYSLAMFFCTAIMQEKYRWSYGRKPHDIKKFGKSTIKLPVVKDENGTEIIDPQKKYSSNGFIPDFEFMEEYIKSLHYKPITTTIKNPYQSKIDTDNWKTFYLHRLFDTGMGNGIDAVATTRYNPKYNYVSRDSNGNGVVGFIDEIDGEKPFPAGTLTLALGGSFLGSCFLQKKPFYTAQNVGILREKFPMSNYTKLFISALIRNECKIKYVAFGRELNAHFRKDFTIKLPVQHDNDGAIILDETKEFSDEGFVPDWEWMDKFMRELPYSDRIES